MAGSDTKLLIHELPVQTEMRWVFLIGQLTTRLV